MSLAERLIELSAWWGSLAAAGTAIWIASKQPEKTDPALILEDECEAGSQNTIATRETA